MRSDILPPTLCKEKNGLWLCNLKSETSYPEGGLAYFHEVEENSFWFRHRNRCITAAMGRYPPNGPIVDIGAGTGFVAASLQSAGFEVIAVEPEIDGALVAHRRGVEHVICGSFEDVGFAPSSIPAIGLFDVLEHIEDDVGALARICALMTPGGRVYLTVPSYEWLFSNEDLVVKHYRRYTIASCTRVLTRAGFVVEYYSYLFAPLPVPIFMLRTIPYRLGRRHFADLNTTAQAHNIGGIAGRIIDRLLDFEVHWISLGRQLYFGSSCLLVARKAARQAS